MQVPKIRKDKPLQSYAIYSNMGIEMAVIIAAGVFGGIKLDKWLQLSPLFTILLSLLGVGIAMYVMIKTLSPKNTTKHESEDTH